MTGRFNVSKAMATGSTGGVDNLGLEMDSSHPTGLIIQQNNNNNHNLANGNLSDSQQHIIPVSYTHLDVYKRQPLSYGFVFPDLFCQSGI